MENVDRTRSEADILEHVLGGIHLATDQPMGIGTLRFEVADSPWLAGTTHSEVTVSELPEVEGEEEE